LVGFFDLTLNLFDQRADVPAVGGTGDHEGIDDTEELGHGQDDRVLPELGIGGLGCRGRSRRELNVDAEPWANEQTMMATPAIDQRTRSRRARACSALRSTRNRKPADGRTA
jgi:hypothetical protein